VRFTLTAGPKGDAPQAANLIEGLPAEAVVADTAYDAGNVRQVIAAVIPNNPSRGLKHPLDKHLYEMRAACADPCFRLATPASLSGIAGTSFEPCPA
jgi:hypothetical protein